MYAIMPPTRQFCSQKVNLPGWNSVRRLPKKHFWTAVAQAAAVLSSDCGWLYHALTLGDALSPDHPESYLGHGNIFPADLEMLPVAGKRFQFHL
jgi:hypothetical protein